MISQIIKKNQEVFSLLKSIPYTSSILNIYDRNDPATIAYPTHQLLSAFYQENKQIAIIKRQTIEKRFDYYRQFKEQSDYYYSNENYLESLRLSLLCYGFFKIVKLEDSHTISPQTVDISNLNDVASDERIGKRIIYFSDEIFPTKDDKEFVKLINFEILLTIAKNFQANYNFHEADLCLEEAKAMYPQNIRLVYEKAMNIYLNKSSNVDKLKQALGDITEAQYIQSELMLFPNEVSISNYGSSMNINETLESLKADIQYLIDEKESNKTSILNKLYNDTLVQFIKICKKGIPENGYINVDDSEVKKIMGILRIMKRKYSDLRKFYSQTKTDNELERLNKNYQNFMEIYSPIKDVHKLSLKSSLSFISDDIVQLYNETINSKSFKKMFKLKLLSNKYKLIEDLYCKAPLGGKVFEEALKTHSNMVISMILADDDAERADHTKVTVYILFMIAFFVIGLVAYFKGYI